MLTGLALVLCLRARCAQAPEADMQQVESDYLLRFADFTEWPPSSVQSDPTTNFCVLGRDPYGRLLDEALLGRTVSDRRIVIVRGRYLQDLGRCEVLFISSSESKKQSKILKQLGTSRVLTVGDAPNFAAMGGMIQFVEEQGRVSFIINVNAAQRAGLKINASLLALAKVIYGDAVKQGGR